MRQLNIYLNLSAAFELALIPTNSLLRPGDNWLVIE
jgi:hypothetical protein